MKPGDEEQLEIHWPEVPTTFSELGDLVIEFGSNTFETVGNLVSKTVDFVQEKEVKKNVNNVLDKNKNKLTNTFFLTVKTGRFVKAKNQLNFTNASSQSAEELYK